MCRGGSGGAGPRAGVGPSHSGAVGRLNISREHAEMRVEGKTASRHAFDSARTDYVCGRPMETALVFRARLVIGETTFDVIEDPLAVRPPHAIAGCRFVQLVASRRGLLPHDGELTGGGRGHQ